MILDLKPLLRGETGKIDVDYMLEPDPVCNVEFTSPAHITGTVTDDGQYMHLQLKAELPYATECARCLTPVKDIFTLEFDRIAVDEGVLTEEQLEDNIDKYVVIGNDSIDIDSELTDEIFMMFPHKILCNPDCPGLCPRCGKPLRDGDCGCPQKDRDPRWDVLAGYFDKDK